MDYIVKQEKGDLSDFVTRCKAKGVSTKADNPSLAN